MKTKTVIVKSQFPASTDVIWEKLQKLSTLQQIAKPYAQFHPVGDTKMTWKEGNTSKFKLKIFGFIPMGIHNITVIQFDKAALSIYTNESNKNVPVWNHRITLEKISENLTLYTDEVEIFANWKTPFVCLWSKIFYKHRQKKWLKLIRGDEC